MGKRFWSLVLCMALIGGAFSALPARAQKAPAVPAAPNVVDPAGDGNGINDQGVAAPVPGDQVGPANVSNVADIRAIWFTHDAASITAHMQTSLLPPSKSVAYFYRTSVGPVIIIGPYAPLGCLWFEAFIPAATSGGTYPTATPTPSARLRDVCTDNVITDGEVTLTEGPDGTGIVSVKIPRSANKAAFADGAVLAGPAGETRAVIGVPGGPYYTAPQIDDTKIGTDYVIRKRTKSPRR